MTISASEIQKLRQKTSCGMMDCKEALEEAGGDFDKAVENLRREKQVLEKQNNMLKQENSKLGQKRDKLSGEVVVLENKLKEKSTQFELLRDKYNQFHRQYDLFEGFIVMAVESGTAENSVSNLIDIFQKLLNDGWCIRRKVDELKSIFVSTVMGDFLKCFKCNNCGASFMVNKEPHNKFVNNYYQCPSCHNSRMVKGDDTFINALVTEEQRENIVHVEGLRKELEILRPFKILLDIPRFRIQGFHLQENPKV